MIARFVGDDPHATQLDGSQQVCFLPGGRSILINQPNGPEAIDYESAKVLQRIPVDGTGGGFAASADCRTVAVVEKGEIDKVTLGVWRWDGTRLRRAGQFDEPAQIRDVGISPDGGTMAISDFDGRVILRGLRDDSRTVLAAVPKETYTSVAFSSDGSMIVQDKAEHEVALWDRESGLLLGAWQFPEGAWGTAHWLSARTAAL